MRAMILAAGLGTRLKPFTDKHPKALAVVNNKTVLQRNIEYLQQFGIDEVIVNVHHFSSQVIDTIKKYKGWGSKISISDESTDILETGGGILKAAWFLEQADDVLVMNADILTNLPLIDMIAYHRRKKPLATLATTNRLTSRYLLFDDDDKLCGWKNVKTGELKGSEGRTKAFSGIQILSKEIFKLFPFTGRFSMIDVYLHLCADHDIFCFDHSHSKMIDIGTMEKLEKANNMFD